MAIPKGAKKNEEDKFFETSVTGQPTVRVGNSSSDPIHSRLSTKSTAAVTSVSASITSVTLKIANVDRVGLLLYNDSCADCFVKYGATASLTDFSVKIKGGGHHFIDGPIYSGKVDAIWNSADGAMKVTEI